ncbi:Chemotaxis protein methyltransferase CheR [Arcticibacter svalbardensis MN12-7]|uniref:histidine kinase n=1 Tax=Arcticibacter svalbardensis MN12-7 TaxID=1150600 RepID=R9GV99_9SPHI|nr:CheR family methyltransferase [Arcticibacter svalbardensis]EOR95598.1 Chemotaxis protein methyltransferase CheR [Arcticibacter svalbardensis MN12-7]
MIEQTGSGDDTVSDLQFPVVGIGASAGGLDAVKQFLKSVPAKSGMAYIFVQHLSPTHESVLTEILERTALIPVHKITDNIHLEKDNLYIIPENKILTAIDGRLRLAPLDQKHHKVKVIDLFFSSLAVVHQSYAVGIVLSGTLNDGTLGLQVIKAYGGITFAQDEASAAYDDMPKNAINTGAVDFVLSPDKIAGQLMRLNHVFQKNGSSTEEGVTGPEQKSEETLKELLSILRVRRNVDFTYYKSGTVKRRIMRRMALKNIATPEEYLVILKEDKEEQDELFNDMLISVTDFFRDTTSFESLCNTILPALISKKNEQETLRIWVAGCATGQEAYSIAICVKEYLGSRTETMKIQIFATDISEPAITRARSGLYRSTEMSGMSPDRLKLYFTETDGSYQISKEIRDLCVFAQHNLLTDPPFSRMDLISCRNVLIYMEPVLQKRILSVFHYALNDQGYLMLGNTESINNLTELFVSGNNREKYFHRKGLRGRLSPDFSIDKEMNFKELTHPVQQEDPKSDVFRLADNLVLAKHSPAGFLLGEYFNILQFRGKTDTWLDPSPGRASLDVLKMIRVDLSFELRNLLHQAKKTKTTARKEQIFFKLNGQQQLVHIEVTPFGSNNEHYYLVLFENAVSQVPNIPLGIDLRDQEIEQMKKELTQIRADMRLVTEEQDAANEELQSANEELLSSTEEMKSLNEELQTSAEELQSTNEEILIINNELQDRNEQLNVAKAYTEEIMNTIRDPLVILDKQLRVKRATKGFYTKFKVTVKETEGQYFYSLGNGQWNIPSLRFLLESVLPEKKVVVDYEVTHIFPELGPRIMCLNSCQMDQQHDDHLILLAIEDITDKRRIEDGLAQVELLFKESKDRLKLAIDAAGLGTWDYNPLNKQLVVDDRCKELFGITIAGPVSFEQFVNRIHPDDRHAVLKKLKQAMIDSSRADFEKELRTIELPGKKTNWIKFKGKVYFNEKGIAYRYVGTALDISLQKIDDEAVAELMKKKDDFMSIASHELKTPITTLKAALQLLERIKDKPSSPMFPMLIEQANKSLVKVGVLIEDLLDVSKLKQGQLHLNKTHVKLSKIVDECCNHVRIAGDYTIKTTGDLNLEAFVDAERINQVVVNFVNNAVKYAPASKEIGVFIEKLEQTVKVSVNDHGPGILASKIPHLFERYYRVDNSGYQYSGLGLGLYISAEIIRRHGGYIGAESELGQGSTFWFTLPLN